MKPLRVGLRAFLLITTLASLLAATVGVRMRVAYRLAAMDHASRAERPRALAAYFGARVRQFQEEIDRQPDSPSVAGVRDAMKASQARYLELIAEAEEQERLARYYDR